MMLFSTIKKRVEEKYAEMRNEMCDISDIESDDFLPTNIENFIKNIVIDQVMQLAEYNKWYDAESKGFLVEMDETKIINQIELALFIPRNIVLRIYKQNRTNTKQLVEHFQKLLENNKDIEHKIKMLNEEHEKQLVAKTNENKGLERGLQIMRGEFVSKDRELENAHNIILMLRTRTTNKIDNDSLRSKINRYRKSELPANEIDDVKKYLYANCSLALKRTGLISFNQLGNLLGVNHKTARAWCDLFEIKGSSLKNQT